MTSFHFQFLIIFEGARTNKGQTNERTNEWAKDLFSLLNCWCKEIGFVYQYERRCSMSSFFLTRLHVLWPRRLHLVHKSVLTRRQHSSSSYCVISILVTAALTDEWVNLSTELGRSQSSLSHPSDHLTFNVWSFFLYSMNIFYANSIEKNDVMMFLFLSWSYDRFEWLWQIPEDFFIVFVLFFSRSLLFLSLLWLL